MYTIQEFYGDHMAKFITEEEKNFAVMVYLRHKPMNNYSTSSVDDVLIQNGVIAILVNRRSWGGSGGIGWDLELEIKCGKEESSLGFKAKDRYDWRKDLRQFWYSTIEQVEHRGNCFFVQFTGDNFECEWKIPAEKQISVHRKVNSPLPPFREQIVYNEITGEIYPVELSVEKLKVKA